jgi:ParB/RepB/Spo0J family partition protein
VGKISTAVYRRAQLRKDILKMARKKAAEVGTSTPDAVVAVAATIDAEFVSGGREIIARPAGLMHIDPDLFIVDSSLNGRYGTSNGDATADAKFDEIKTSIARIGVLQPILFDTDDTGTPRVRVGFRRLAAVKQLREAYPDDERFHTIPALPLEAPGAVELLRANLDENLQRKDLTAMDYAVTIKRFKDAGMSQAQVAEAMHRDKSWVSKRITLLRLPVELQARVHAGELDADVAYELVKKGGEVQHAAAATLAEVTAAETLDVVGEAAATGAVGKKRARKAAKKAKAALTRGGIKAARVVRGKGAGKSKKLAAAAPARSDGRTRAFFLAVSKDTDVISAGRDLATAIVRFIDGKIDETMLDARFKHRFGLVPTATIKKARAKAKTAGR